MRIQREAIPFVEDQPNVRRGLTVIEVLVVLAIIALLILLLLPAVQTARYAPRRPQCRNNLKQIGLALHNYHDVYGSFPPAYTVDASGRRLHSWRTLILPFVDQAPLYMKIDLSKPWDDPVHAEIARTAISTFACPEFQSEKHLTLYHAVVTQDSILKPGTSAKFADVTDGLSSTLVVIETDTARAVPWMSPTDEGAESLLQLTEKSATAHKGGCQALFGDGSVRFVPNTEPADARQSMITATAGDKSRTD